MTDMVAEGGDRAGSGRRGPDSCATEDWRRGEAEGIEAGALDASQVPGV